MRCLLIGNYGIGNFGDEALKEYFFSAFPDVEWQVLSAYPRTGEFYRLPAGIRSLFSPWWRTLKAMRKADAIVFGGGTLFTDVESPWACVIWLVHAFVAYLFHKPIVLAYQGIGPFHTKTATWIGKWVVRHAAFLSVRDQLSMARVQAWHPSIKIVQTFDPVYSLIPEQKRDGSQKVFILIPRHNSGHAFIQRALDLLSRHPTISIRILSFEPANPSEQAVCRSIIDALPMAVLKPVVTMQDLIQGLEGADHVLTERYHGALAALAAGIRFDVVSQKQGDKLSTLQNMKEFDRSHLRQQVLDGEKALRSYLDLGK